MAPSTVIFRSVGPHRFTLYATCILFFVALVHFLDLVPGRARFTLTERYGDNRLIQQLGHQEPLGEAKQCGYLKNLGLSKNIQYSRRCVKPVFPDDVDRDTVTNVSSPLITSTTTVNVDDLCSIDVDNRPCEPLVLPVPRPDPENSGQYAHLLFGIATTSKRLMDSKQSFGHWLANSGATLICMILDEPEELLSVNFESLEAEYAASGMKLTLVGRQNIKHTPEQSHLLVIRDMLSYATSSSTQTHWLGILDDDTFFPSLHALSVELARHDHTRSRYLGALTENADFLHQGVLGAWGGAGVFISLALAKEMEPHLDECLSSRGGDMQIMECIHVHSHARLTMVEGLWQMDVMGDTAGVYESGRKMLSMHHWKSWHWLPVHEMAAVTRFCGDCFLERFAFAAPEDERLGAKGVAKGMGRQNGAMVLNVGYSINLYSEGLPDLSRTEQTWDGRNAWKDYEWSIGPLRPGLDRQDKKTWLFKTAFFGERRELTQVYLHKGDEEDEDEDEYDEVIELIWAS